MPGRAVDKDKIRRCLERAKEVSILDAVKELDLNEEESGIILDLMMEKMDGELPAGTPAATGRSGLRAGHSDSCGRGAEGPALMPMVREFCERQARMEEGLNKMVDYLIALEKRFESLCEATDGLLDAVHPGATGGAPASFSPEAKARIISLARHRPPTRTPPEPRKGA